MISTIEATARLQSVGEASPTKRVLGSDDWESRRRAEVCTSLGFAFEALSKELHDIAPLATVSVEQCPTCHRNSGSKVTTRLHAHAGHPGWAARDEAIATVAELVRLRNHLVHSNFRRGLEFLDFQRDLLNFGAEAYLGTFHNILVGAANVHADNAPATAYIETLWHRVTAAANRFETPTLGSPPERRTKGDWWNASHSPMGPRRVRDLVRHPDWKPPQSRA